MSINRENSQKKWKIFVVAHNKVHASMYSYDRTFDAHHFPIINVSESDIDAPPSFEVLQQNKLPNYRALGKWWAESEAVYNIWKSGEASDLDFVGFLHYDKELCMIKKYLKWISIKDHQVCEKVEKYLNNSDRAHISFEPAFIRDDYGQKIMMDEKYPNILTGDGINCYDKILTHYNTFFSTDHSLQDFFDKERINLCSCFMIDVKTFDKMMRFMEYIVDLKCLDSFDTDHKYRFHGGMMERYFGLFLAFEYDHSLELNLIHHYNSGLK